MRFLLQKMFVSVLLLTTTSIIAQSKKGATVEQSFFKGGEIAKENFIGSEKTIDSIKTYYLSGQLDERFYFNKKGQLDGLGQKNSEDGILMVTWLYKKSVLMERKDYLKKPSNIKTKKQVDFNYANIKSCDSLLKINPKRVEIIYSKACSQNYLGENILSEIDFVFLKNSLEKLKSSTPSNNNLVRDDISKKLADVYGRLSTIYNRFGNESLRLGYLYKAVQASPTSNIHRYNLGAAFAIQVEDYRLALYFLEEVIRTRPNHNFANWVLSHIYLEFEQYQKALDCVNIAFKSERGLYENGYGNVEEDLRTIRGIVYHKLGKTELGIQDLNKALEINDKNSVANKHLGIVYSDLGENNKACGFFQKSRELGYEKKYYNKSLEQYIKKTCIVENTIVEIPAVINQNNVKNSEVLVQQNSIETTEILAKDLPYIAPNPAEDFVEVYNYSPIDFNFNIFDASGKQILSGVSTNKTIQVSVISTGFYILMIEKDGKTEKFKLIKK